MTKDKSDSATSARLNRVLLLFSFLTGVTIGLGVYLFNYAEGTSYFSDDPNACVNCHVMRDQFEGWNHSSHKAFATCNDCHTPRGFPEKWLVKGRNGWNHSVAFTLGNFHDPIRIHDFNKKIVQQNCITCHQELVSEIIPTQETSGRFCIDCHGNVGHGR